MTTVSVVIPTFNSSLGIEACISSLAEVSSLIDELIIIDGLSTDGTVQLAQEFSSLFSSFSVVSEADDGISDAFNKGVLLSTSDYIFIIGSDDVILPKGFRLALDALAVANPDILLSPILSGKSSRLWTTELRSVRSKNSFIHPGSFVKKSLYGYLGLYDTSFRVAMDYEFFSRAFCSGAEFFLFLDGPVVLHARGGISSNKLICFKESFRVRRKYFSAFFPFAELLSYAPSLIRSLFRFR